MPGVAAGAVAVGLMRAVPYPTAQQIAQEQGNPDTRVIDLRVADSRDILSKSWLMADEALANTAFVDYAGTCVLPTLAISTADFDTEKIIVTQNESQTCSKISPIDWDCHGAVAEFLGTTLPTTEMSCRLTQHALSTTTYPNFTSQLVGYAGTLRGIVYGVTGKVQSAPGLAVWWRNSGASTPSANAPISDYYDYGSLAEGSYAEISVSIGAGWSNSTANLNFNWIAEPEATSANGKIAALPPLIVERDGPGVVVYNPSVGGAILNEHWLNTDVVPAAFWSEVLPRIVGDRKLHLTIDIGTNGGDSDSSFAAHMRQLIALVRAAVPTARVVIRTAYAMGTDGPAGQKSYCNAIYDDVLGADPSVAFIDTRAILPDYATMFAAGWIPDTVHLNDDGVRYQGKTIDAAMKALAEHGQHSCNFATDLSANPLQVGIPYLLTGRCWPANESVEVTINGISAGTAVGVNRTWEHWVTPTEVQRDGGAPVDVIATPSGVAEHATTRPTTIAAAA